VVEVDCGVAETVKKIKERSHAAKRTTYRREEAGVILANKGYFFDLRRVKRSVTVSAIGNDSSALFLQEQNRKSTLVLR